MSAKMIRRHRSIAVRRFMASSEKALLPIRRQAIRFSKSAPEAQGPDLRSSGLSHDGSSRHRIAASHVCRLRTAPCGQRTMPQTMCGISFGKRKDFSTRAISSVPVMRRSRGFARYVPPPPCCAFRELPVRKRARKTSGMNMKKGAIIFYSPLSLSGRLDSNQRPPTPEAGALTGLRYTPNDIFPTSRGSGIRTSDLQLPKLAR